MNYHMDINVHCIQFIFHLIQYKRTLFEKHMQCEIVLINEKKKNIYIYIYIYTLRKGRYSDKQTTRIPFTTLM